MTHAEILEKAIKKAIANGWLKSTMKSFKGWRIDAIAYCEECGGSGGWVDELHRMGKKKAYQWPSTEELLFNHDFAKALWGEEIVYSPTGKRVYNGSPNQRVALLHPTLSEWKFHLQQMVIADDPIKYLGENIDD